MITSVAGWSEPLPARTQLFRISEGYAAAISVSPRGTVWVRHGNVPLISWFDGYQRGQITAPEISTFRVYESRSGQLWTVCPDGLLRYDRGQWTRHTIPEIRAELSPTTPLRPLKQIPLIPAEIDHVFILLSDRLIEYDGDTHTVTLIRKSAETSLGRFSEMQESHETKTSPGIWVSAEHGLARIDGPLRHFDPRTPWKEFVIPANLHLERLQRPFEGPAGEIVVLASEAPESTRKFLVEFKNGNWSAKDLRSDRLRQVWRAWDDSPWGFSFTGAVALQASKDSGAIEIPGPQYDVAMEPIGPFWLANGEGVVRYAPLLWRPLPDLRINTPTHALFEEPDENGAVWLGTELGLLEYRNGKVTTNSWPADPETRFQPGNGIHQLKDGRLVVSSIAFPFIFDPPKKVFSSMIHPAGRLLKVLGQRRDGTIIVRTTRRDNPAYFHLEVFDGRTFRHFLEPDTSWNLGSDVSFALETEAGDLWLGGGTGFGVYHEATQQFEPFGPAQGFISDRVTCAAEVGEGRVWFGSDDRIFEYRGKKLEPLQSGLDRVNSINKAKDSSIWVASNNGVHHVIAGTWIDNDSEEGLPGTVALQTLEDRQGRIWVAANRGISVYHPDADMDAPRTIEAKVANPEDGSRSGVTTLSFNAADKWQYTPQGSLLYSWRLDNSAWSGFSTVSSHSFQELGSGKHQFEVRAMDRNGNRESQAREVEFMVVVPWFKDPRLTGVLVLALIITLFFAGLAVNRQIRLRKSYEAVEAIVRQRTSELEKANAELLHSHKMKALGTLAAGIAHDFNNILSIIRGSAQIIETNLGDHDKIQTRVQRIQTVVEQGAGIVRSLLGLGKLNEKELVLCNPSDLAESSVRLLADRFPREIKVSIEYDPNLPETSCAADVLQQMLINLLLNASDALTNGPGEIIVSVRHTPHPATELILPPAPAQSYVTFSVADNGAGISPEVLPRIFEPFYTTKAFSSRRGTGLGLSMVYELAKGLEYGLTVKSQLGKGTQFGIIVPVRTNVSMERLEKPVA
ncbi:MAG: Blue-light-activated protein [Verrucomicrobiales bacterium]|nr:Blue-light-activated protein [Verrucomicrobiales bacterium]